MDPRISSKRDKVTSRLNSDQFNDNVMEQNTLISYFN